MANNIIKGRKGGGSKQRTPTEQPDDLQSVAKAKILLALGEGEFAGGLTGKDIYLDGTPLENADGSQNFSGVSWEFRPGTQAQTYIQGIPGTENEISIGTEVSSKTAWTHTFTNTQLSAVRVRLKWPSLMKQEDDGDVVGNTVKYAIDLQTDGGAWQTVLETAVTGKTTSGYERSHRIDLPHAGSTWTLRLRKISPDANSVKVGDVMTLQSYTEVIDAKLRYPNTALLYIEFDSSQFNGSIPQISCEPRGRVIRVPDNYNPETREYTGVWTGGFKWAWTDNPAWIYYDIVIADSFGLGNRLSSANISKWTLYQIAQYCDQLVPDGRGGDGMEPRYTCNVYVQERNDAYTVLRDFAAIFRGMTCWNGEQIVVQADMPRDVDFTYTRANIIGKPRYSSSSSQVRYTNALVSWSDPDNAYADAMEPAFIPELVSRYSFNQLELTAIGCTRQSEAHRKGLWGITSTQQTHATALEALATQQTTLTSSVGDLSASVQNTAKTVADVNGTVSSLWSMKVETVNGKNVGAGITLGSNGETSDMILYADRFSLFNRNNATAVPVMIAEGNELYIDTARIKNSSLTSTKIADGSITNAKIGNEIRSNDFVDGSRGWRIAKDGSSQFNNVIVRGAVYATDGWFQGTIYANRIEGDIGSFAINIAQHRTRKVPKATWQWFELARFRRQNFDQVINIRGGLLQTDSITIDGGAKLRAGMSYAPGSDGGLDPGYLSYAMLLRGTGATSGGGSMELGIELMYETGGATRLLTAQESMNVDNMSFVVPAGTGDAVLRYGCYLDRNGQMVLTILSRFDAFAARNNNVIRAASSA